MILLGCGALVVALGAFDWATGVNYDFFVLYYVPIGIASWKLGRAPGFAVAVLSAAAWLAVDTLTRANLSVLQEAVDETMRLASFLGTSWAFSRIRTELTRQQETSARLAAALAEVKQLQGILSMCSFCRRIRNGGDDWVPVEAYLSKHSDARVSHGLCPTCYRKHYGDPDGT